MTRQRQDLIKDLYTAITEGTIIREERQLFTERELCELFKVKRSLLREALVALETLGIIDIQERQGMFLANKPNKMLSESLSFLSEYSPILLHDESIEARLMIEPHMASLAAKNGRPRQKTLLENELLFVENLYRQKDIGIENKASQAYQHNIILHSTIAEMTDNTVMTYIYRYLADLSRNVHSALGRGPYGFQPYALWPDILLAEHRRIVEAILAQDEMRAAEAMYVHLKNSQQRNQAVMAQQSQV